jgi:hypothetical protein
MEQSATSSPQRILRQLELLATHSQELMSLTLAPLDLSSSDLALVLERHADVFDIHVGILRRYAEVTMARCEPLARGDLTDPAIGAADHPDVDLSLAIPSLQITARLLTSGKCALLA